jgi:Homeodomain-like domain
MAPTKLSELDKQNIITLYRQPEETTANIAIRYGVSTTTISRILRQSLPEEEYEALIQLKRSGVTKLQIDEELSSETVPPFDNIDSTDISVDEEQSIPDEEPTVFDTESIPKLQRRQRKRPTVVANAVAQRKEPKDQLPLLELDLPDAVEQPELTLPQPFDRQVSDFQEILQEEILNPVDDYADDLEDEDDELGEELDDDDDFDDDDLEDDDSLDEAFAPEAGPLRNLPTLVQGETMLQVLPLAEATIPKIFYLVIDRSAELITRPLKDFADLGRIPEAETLERTLPIFDNHRVAKRFLRRSQRVIKIPDGRVLTKVGPYLQAKGITRLLIDGQVYSLKE